MSEATRMRIRAAVRRANHGSACVPESVKRTRVYREAARRCMACHGWFPGEVFDVDRGLCMPCGADLGDHDGTTGRTDGAGRPLVKGGQGRSGEDVEDAGCLAAVALVVIGVVCLLAGLGVFGYRRWRCGREKTQKAQKTATAGK
jgi:hypothetical protein